MFAFIWYKKSHINFRFHFNLFNKPLTTCWNELFLLPSKLEFNPLTFLSIIVLCPVICVFPTSTLIINWITGGVDQLGDWRKNIYILSIHVSSLIKNRASSNAATVGISELFRINYFIAKPKRITISDRFTTLP